MWLSGKESTQNEQNLFDSAINILELWGPLKAWNF